MSMFGFTHTFYCNSCHETFEEPLQSVVPHDELDGYCRGDYEYFCPHCGSDDFEPAYSCSKCGKWLPEHQGKFMMCADCERDIFNRFELFKSTLTESEKDLCEWYGFA